MSDVIYYTLFQTVAVGMDGTYDFPIWARDEAHAREIHATYLGGQELVYLKVVEM